jgi:hypothetical protein
MASTILSSSDVLESALGFWEVTEIAAAGIVLVGVIGEFLADFTKIVASQRSKERLGKLSTLVLILGLTVEVVALVRTSQLSGLITAQFHREAAMARRDAENAKATAKGFESHIAEANSRANSAEAQVASANALSRDAQSRVKVAESRIAEARGRIAEAEARSSEARSMAEHERLERLRLEAQVAPRRLTPDQKAAITNSCRPFSRHLFSHRSIEIVTYALDQEAAVLAQQIREALSSAGLTVDFKLANVMPLGGFMTGIQVTGPESQRDLVLGVAVSLLKDGKLAVIGPRFTGPDSKVSILIGVKPIT